MQNNPFKLIAFTAAATAGAYFFNKHIDNYSVAQNKLKVEPENFFKWKNLNIYYTKYGSLGSPVILLHDINPAASSVEWDNRRITGTGSSRLRSRSSWLRTF